eukprot:c18253_g1_i5 orf=1154-1942(+)
MEIRAATGLATAVASPNLNQRKSVISRTPSISILSKSRPDSAQKESMCFLTSEGYSSRKLRSHFFDSWSYPYILVEEQKSLILWPSSRFSQKVVARLFGPAIFEDSKLKVLFLGTEKDKHPEQLPRTYTLTHSDISAKLTLAISQTINKAQFQGWYSQLQRDEVLAEWKKAQGSMSLHVHCHISGGHWLLNTIAKLRFYIFRKELPVVLEAFRRGDRTLLRKHPGSLSVPQFSFFELLWVGGSVIVRGMSQTCHLAVAQVQT